MSNPFENKIKESLENFEMPYDANAWAQFEKQLPQSGGTATGGSRFSWKAVALVAVLTTSVATIWYLNADKEVAKSESVVVEQEEITQEQSVIVEKNSSQLSKPAVLAKESKEVSSSEKPQIADPKKVVEVVSNPKLETKEVNSENVAKPANSDIQNPEKKAATPADKPSPDKTEAKPLVANFIPTLEKVCVGEDVSFINQTSDPKAKMVWDFGDGTTSSAFEPSHTYVLPGTYSVKLKAAIASKASEQTVNVSVSPVPTVTLDASQKLPGYDAIPFYHFETVLQPNETATWKFSDGSTTKGSSADHLFRDAGKATATLTVQNAFGCSHSDEWESRIAKAFDDLMAPTGFSPDGNGTNDVFIPGALPDLGVAFEMVIMDLKGQEVYRTSSANEPWNGKLHNTGAKLDVGTYAWTVVLKEEIVSKKTFSGTISIRL
ncbi:MAG: PKD domain-containing protein [Flavobacteriales bacterium]|nr:PKD domain-containing protein [Flavobacteriales bacterium]